MTIPESSIQSIMEGLSHQREMKTIVGVMEMEKWRQEKDLLIQHDTKVDMNQDTEEQGQSRTALGIW